MDELYKHLQLQIIAECQKSVEKTMRDKTESLFIKKYQTRSVRLSHVETSRENVSFT